MQENYTRDKTFDRQDYSQRPWAIGEYENCCFNSCNFAGQNLSECIFVDCTFIGCNLSMAILNKTAWHSVHFKDCKMLGLRFDTCNPFGLSFSFDHCQLNHASFYQTKIRKTKFHEVQLQEADFTDCDLSESVLAHCDLSGAIFDHTNLSQADFRTAVNYSINPEGNRIKKAKFSRSGISGLLDKYDIDIEA